MAQKGHQTILVKNVMGDGPRLKILGIVDKQNFSYIEKIITVLSNKFNMHHSIPDVQALQTPFLPNTLCCVKYRGSYVRAKVMSVQANGVVVELIDSGIFDLLPMELFRFLYANSEEESMLLAIPPLAKEFTLANIVSINEKWESKHIQSILSLIKDQELEVSHYDFHNNRYFVKLVYRDTDIGSMLVNKRMAVMATIEDMFRSKMYSQQPPYKAVGGSHEQQVPAEELTTNGYSDAQRIYNASQVAQLPTTPSIQPVMAVDNWRFNQQVAYAYQHNLSQQNFPQQNFPPQKVVQRNVTPQRAAVEEEPKILEFRGRLLDVGQTYRVFVSYVEDGPNKFSVQIESMRETLMSLMSEIQSHEPTPLREPPLPGSVCLARLKSNKCICRAVVMATMETQIKIYYVDFGHTDVVPYSDIYQLPPKFINPKVLSIRFCLTGLKEMNITEEAKKYFTDVIQGQDVDLQVCEPEGPFLIQYGNIFYNNKNVKDYLIDRFPDIAKVEYGHLPALTDGTKETVHVSYVDCCSKFFVQLEKNIKDIEDMMTLICDYATDAPPMSKLAVGSICIAPYDVDNQWYRVKILKILGDKVTVLYVDYGNEETVSKKQLRNIRRDLVAKMPSQAIPCVLNGFQNRASNKEVDTEFENLTFEKRLSMMVKNAQPTGLVVDLFDIMTTPAKSINTQLIKMSVEQGSHSHNESNISRNSNESYKSQGQNHHSGDMGVNKTSSGPGSNPFQTANNYDRSNSKSWKDDRNEQRHDSLYQRREENERFPRDGGNRAFNREVGNNPVNRDRGFNHDGNDRFNRDAGSNRFRDGGRFNNRDDRSGGGRFGSNKQGFNADKSAASDNESTSSRGSGKRVERDFQSRRYSNDRPSFNKFGNDNGGFKSRRNDDSTGSNVKTRSARDDGFGKPREIINFDTPSDFSEPKKRAVPLPTVSIGGTNSCELVYLTNPSNFFIHQIPQNTTLDELMESISLTYESGGTILQSSQVKPDLVCIAQFADDEKWYRAIIKSVEGTKAVVLFVDYGNVEKVKFEQLKEIKEEFTYLPMQAVPCKLFGVKKTDWTDEEINSFGEITNGKYLQVEFVTKDKDVHEVLLRDMEGDVVTPNIINESFCPGVDLLQEKEALKNRGKPFSLSVQKIQPDYASMGSKWSEEKVSPGTKEAVLVTWFDNPDNFYCQSIIKQREFRPMMEEIQDVYGKRQPVNGLLQPGCAVITIFPEDGAFYRAEIVDVNDNRNYVVQYVDFGNKATVDHRNMFPVEKKYMTLPKQAVRCSLKNVIPANGGSWSKVYCKEVDKYFDNDELDCTYHEEKDGKYLVSLSNNGTDIGQTLVVKKLAVSAVAGSATTVNGTMTADSGDISAQRFDIQLLPGQTLRAKVSNVESVSKFYVQFSTVENCNQAISSYMTKNEPKMLALPSQLAVMQNQAIECSLDNIQQPSSLNEKFKNLVDNKDVIIHVEEVDKNRLIVQLYDPLGRKIQLTDDVTKAKISPVCPMPILSSTHKVAVAYANHSNSLWLQMMSDAEKDEKLHREMKQFYSVDREIVVPEPGVTCALQNKDGTCCRVSIIRKTTTGAYVNLIDYGVHEDVPVDRLKVLDPQFYVPHQLAIKVSLNVTLVGTAVEQARTLKPHLQSKEFTATFYNVHKKWIVELVENGVKLSETLTSLNLIKETTATKSEEGRGIALGEKFKAAVTHCDSPAQFWLQRSDETPIVLELQSELQNAISRYPAVDRSLEVGTLCAAVFEGFWYRAEIIDEGDDISTVRFIDYGNPDVITNKTGKIKEIPDSLKMKKAYAVKCRLNVVPVDSEDWSEETCARFSNLVVNAENLEAALIAESATNRIDLFINEKSVSDILVEERLAIKVNHEEELIEEIIENELDPRSAFISHINSPNDFFVQEEKSVPDLEKIQDRFLVADMLPEVEDITEGLLCVAKYTDDNWYRARVISQSEAGTQLLFIDYGNSAVSTEIRAIPDDVASIPPLSRKCSLQLPSYVSCWPERALENFCELAAEGATIFLMDVLKEEETTIVKLTLEDEDIAEKLAPPRSIFISHINSPSDFWVQEVQDVPEIDKVQEQLIEADNYPTVQIEEGLICAAKFPDDEQWYRAKVLSQGENGTVVLFIDYGNSSVSTEVRALPEGLLSLAPFAKRCSLQLPSHAKEWPAGAFDTFCNLAGDGIVAFFIDVIEEGETLVVKLIYNKENIAEKLVPRVTNNQEQKVPKNKTTITCTSFEIETAIPKEHSVLAEVHVKKAELIPVYISQLTSPSEFWVQEEKIFDELQNMEDSLIQADGFLQLNEVTEGSLCAAKFPIDSVWYRAKILFQDEEGTTVSFVDCGNSSVVTDMRTLPENVAVVPFLAKRCSLKLPQNLSEWPEEAVKQFLQLSADGTTCFAMDVIEDGETAVVSLYLDGESVADKLTPCASQPICVEEGTFPESQTDVPEEEYTVSKIEISAAEEVIVLENETNVPEEEYTVSEIKISAAEKIIVLEKENTVPEELTIPEEISVGTKYSEPGCEKTSPKLDLVSVYISQLSSPSEFWVQEEKIFDELQKMEDSLIQADGFLQLNEAPEDSLCAAKFPIDSLWYRAKVLCQDEKGTIVSFVDYGNSSVVTDMRTLPDNIAVIPSLAKRCSLKLPQNLSEWPEEAVKQFLQLSADGTTCFAMNVLEDGETALVSLYLDGESVADKLSPCASQPICVEEGTFPESQTDVPEEEYTVSEIEISAAEEVIVLENKTTVPEELTITEVISVETKDSEPECEKNSPKLDLVSVYISQLSSPSEFWVQEEKIFDEIQKMEDSLIQADGFLQLNEVTEGSLCAAKFPIDSLWYRAKVLSQDEEGTTVSFVDYGNSSLVTDMRTLPENIAVIPSLAKRCSLKIPQNLSEWPEEAVNQFRQLSADGTTCFAMDVFEEGETALVSLYLDGESVADKLTPCASQAICVEEGTFLESQTDVPEEEYIVSEIKISAAEEVIVLEKETTVSEEFTIPEEISVETKDNEPECEKTSPKLDPVSIYISQLNSPKEFWVQEEESASKLHEVEEMLLNIGDFPRVEEVKEGLFCAAQFPAGLLWYRAKVVSHNENETTVCFIDYGNSSTVTELRLLSEELQAVPPLAKKCSLKLPLDVLEWSHEACTEFFKLSADSTTVFVMDVLEDGEPVIVDLKLDGENVAAKLVASISQKFAEKETAVIGHEEKELVSGIVADAKVNEEDGEDVSQILESMHDFSKEITGRLTPEGEEPKAEIEVTKEQEFQPKKAEVIDLNAESEPDTLKEEIPELNAESDPDTPKEEIPELNAESDPDTPKEEIPEENKQVLGSPDSSFHSAGENGPDESFDSSQVSHEAEPAASSSMEKEDHDLPSTLLESVVDQESTLPFSTPPSGELRSAASSSMEKEDHDLPSTLESVVDPESTLPFSTPPSGELSSEQTVGLILDDIVEKMTYEPEEDIGIHCLDNKVPKIQSVDKLVPGSVSQGLSETEIIHGSIERRRSIPHEDKIVPGSISRGDDLPDSDSESSSKSEPITKSYSIVETSLPTTPKISYDDRIVAGSISRGESPDVEVTRPLTPRTPHSEKIVAGVVNLQEPFLETESEEILEVHVEEQHS